jgi:hypothetical protein
MADSSNPTPRDAPDAPGVGVWRNHRALALVSFLLSLVYPLGVTLFMLGRGSIWGTATVGAATPPAYWVGSVLEIVGVPALIAAIISGHIALGRAKRYPLEHAGWALASAALVFGYLSLLVVLGEVGTALWILTHPIEVHFTF